MLKIRQEQMEILTQDAEARFERQVIDHLSQNFAAETNHETPQTLLKRVKLHIATARGYTITTSRDIIDFSTLCVLLGDRFHFEMHWAKETLGDPHNQSIRMTELKDAAIKYLDDSDDDGL